MLNVFKDTSRIERTTDGLVSINIEGFYNKVISDLRHNVHQTFGSDTGLDTTNSATTVLAGGAWAAMQGMNNLNRVNLTRKERYNGSVNQPMSQKKKENKNKPTQEMILDKMLH